MAHSWRTLIHDTSDHSETSFISEHIDVHTSFNVFIRSDHNYRFLPVTTTTNQSHSRLQRDLISSPDESIRAAAIHEVLSSIPIFVESGFIVQVVPEISLSAFKLVSGRRIISMSLIIDLILCGDQRELLDRVLMMSQPRVEVNNNLGFKPASKRCIDELKRARVQVTVEDCDGDEEKANSMEDCSICFEKYSVGEEVIWLPCKHVFHGDCILKWLQTNSLCPLCRFSMSN